MRVGRTRYALVEHEGLLASTRRGSGEPTKADASEAAITNTSGATENMREQVELLSKSCNINPAHNLTSYSFQTAGHTPWGLLRGCPCEMLQHCCQGRSLYRNRQHELSAGWILHDQRDPRQRSIISHSDSLTGCRRCGQGGQYSFHVFVRVVRSIQQQFASFDPRAGGGVATSSNK